MTDKCFMGGCKKLSTSHDDYCEDEDAKNGMHGRCKEFESHDSYPCLHCRIPLKKGDRIVNLGLGLLLHEKCKEKLESRDGRVQASLTEFIKEREIK